MLDIVCLGIGAIWQGTEVVIEAAEELLDIVKLEE